VSAGNPEGVAALRARAIQRLMTICPHPTPKEREIYAEWIVDAIIDAAIATNAQMHLEILP
jgi:hypothetical protein